MKRFLIWAFISLLILSGCQKASKVTVVYYEYFDTLTEITYYHSGDSEESDNINKVAEQTLKKYHQLFDIYNGYDGVTNLFSVNSSPTEKHQVEDILQSALQLCLDNYEQVRGKTNVFAGRLFSLWHDAREDGDRIPSDDDIKEALNHTDPEFFDIDTFSFSDNTMSIDCGAVAKGIAAEAIADNMKKAGAISGIVNLGGNILCFGSAEKKSAFTIGIQDPDGNGLIAKARINNASLVTSGDYQRTYNVDGIDYHHIIDPHTGYPEGEFRSVTVYHNDSAIADFLSTSLFLMSEEDGRSLAAHYGAGVLWCRSDKNIAYTENFPIIK